MNTREAAGRRLGTPARSVSGRYLGCQEHQRYQFRQEMTCLLARWATLAYAGLFASFGSTGCAKGDSDIGRIPGPMTSALLAFAAEQDLPEMEVVQSWRTIDSIASRIAARAPRSGASLLDRMNQVIFDELGFTREVTDTDPSFLLLPTVLKNRRGGCVGLSALYLALSERLNLPATGVLVPGHFFVRVTDTGAKPDGRVRNVELLRRGEAMPDAWYVAKYMPPPTTDSMTGSNGAGASPYLRPLTIDQVVAVHWFNIGNHRRDMGDLAAAAKAYARAANMFPTFPEAVASDGRARQLQGDLDGAARAYANAARARPDLPGLAQNMTILQIERARGAPPPSLSTPQPHAPDLHSGSMPRRASP